MWKEKRCIKSERNIVGLRWWPEAGGRELSTNDGRRGRERRENIKADGCCQPRDCLPGSPRCWSRRADVAMSDWLDRSRSLRMRPNGSTVFTHADRTRGIAIDGRSILATLGPQKPLETGFFATRAYQRLTPVVSVSSATFPSPETGLVTGGRGPARHR